MEGALPSVVGGLVARPVIAVPTSVGYGLPGRNRRAARDAQLLRAQRERGQHRQRVSAGFVAALIARQAHAAGRAREARKT